MKRIITLLSILLFAWTLSAQVKLVQVERSSAKWHIPVAKRVIPGAPGFAMTYMELQHLMDSIGLAAAADSIYLSNDTIFLRDGSGFVVIPEQTNPDSIYLSNDTIYLRDGSGFVKLPGGGGGTVNSVGLATGTGGTDINVTGSPITTSGTFTLNIPNSGPTSRGALTAADYNLFNNKPGGSGATNKLAFWSGTNALSSNTNFHVDNTNSRIGLGITSGLTAWLNINGQSGVGYSKAIEIQSPGGWVTSWLKSYNSSSPTQRGLSFGGIQAGGTDFDHLLVLNNFQDQGVGIKTQYPLTNLHITTPYAGSSNNGIRHDHNASFYSLQQINSEGDIIFRSTSGNMSVGPISTSIQDLNPTANIHLFAPGGFGENELFKIERAGGWGFTSFNQYTISGGNRGLKIRDSYGGNAIFTTEQISKRIGINQETPASTLHVGGNLTVDTRTGTPASLAAWTSAGVAATANLGAGLSFSGTDVVATDQSASNELITAVTSMGLSAGGNTIVITEAGTSRTGVIPPMTGATAGAAGIQGVVPAPAAGNQNKFLRGDGTWQDAGGSLSGSTGYLPFFNSATTLGTSSVSYRSDAIFGIGFGLAPASITSDIHLGTGKQLEFDGTATIIDKNNSGGGADEILTRAATGGGLDWRGLGLINGQSLLNGDITINSGITGTGSAGRVAFWTGVSTQSNSNNLFWDNSASRLGIGTLTPSRALDNAGASRLRGAIYDSADSPGTTGQVMTSNGASAWTWNTPPTNSVIVATNIVNFTTTVTGQRVLELSQTDINTGGFTFDNANDYITINATGVYEVTFSGNMGNDVAASNIWFQRWNGTTWDFLYGNVEGRIPMIVSAGFDYPTVYITSITNLNNGDRIRVVRNHSSGHTLHHMTSHLKIKRIS